MKTVLGLLRSLAIYRARPGRARRMRDHYRPFVRQNELVFDIGAHVGNRTRAFYKLGARVVALEPQPELATFLRFAFRRAAPVSVIENAVGATPGTAELFICRRNPTISTTSRDWHARSARTPGFERFRFEDPVRVPQTTLDELIAQFGIPAFVKIDVEGSEDEALAGLSTPVAALSFEFLPQDREVALRALARVDALGDYSYNVSLGETLEMVWGERWCAADQLRSYLAEIPPDGPSGDIYARRV